MANNGDKSAILNLMQLTFFRAYPSLKTHILYDGNDLAIWHGLPYISHIKVINGRRSAILNLIELNIFMAYPYLIEY